METDWFYVHKLALDPVQEMRVTYLWEALDQQKAEMELAWEVGRALSRIIWRTKIHINNSWPGDIIYCSKTRANRLP
ncbi:hypothetical protein [Cyclobacterium jeungdonense]|uniref:Uncharacterized protein n=1 Tax=Cyclobacterium jeungdonense TaxID=708087 RepID=A0ABT8C6M5_9BACT|nr:hypothetical protein [Cyclobacterium jeungdonense]MDN3688448.1 hypothetical protein [Cyclobacterium jeungdonense]